MPKWFKKKKKILFEQEFKTYVNIDNKKILGINGHAFLSAGYEETLPLIGGLPIKNNKILKAKIIVYDEEMERLGNGKDMQIARQDIQITKILKQDAEGEYYGLNRKSKR